MLATREAEPSSARRAPPRRRPIPVALSLAVHVALLYALTRAPLPVSEARTPLPATTAVVWLRELPARGAPMDLLPEHTVEPPSDAIEQPPIERVTPPAPKRAARRKPAAEPVPQVVEPTPPVQTAPAPRIDWDKQRQAAVRDTVENPRGRYKTLSLSDLPERKPEPLPIEPAPKAMTARCVIFKNRFQAALLGMVGICVRDAQGSLFADAQPPYVDEHPVCRETRPDSPGAVASDGRVISTVKCDLVADDDDVTEVRVEVDLDSPL